MLQKMQKTIALFIMVMLLLFPAWNVAAEPLESETQTATESGTQSETESGTQIESETQTQPARREIHTCEELLQIAADPAGDYVLMEDLDLAGVTWKPIDFTGSFDGGGHSLLNLKITEISGGIEDTFDGNRKQYETSFAGLFGTLKGAEVKNVNLINVRVHVTTDVPCFIGSIAGYSADSKISGCHVQGQLELEAHEKMFGVGGLVGYGNGALENCSADVTLICTDTDAATKDEQFMGGAYATGFMDVDGCEIKINGYVSDHGYVHNGGLIGMYMIHPRNLKYTGKITNNKVVGQITFFEDNKDRRAYCKGLIGEVMNRNYKNSKNTEDFKRNEIFTYSVDLKPDPCEDPEYEETVTEPGCDTFGYTTRVCKGCGYTDTDHYTLYRHSVKEWKVTKEPTVENTGIQTGVCELCKAVLEEELAKLEPPAETESGENGSADQTSEPMEGNASEAGSHGQAGGLSDRQTDVLETVLFILAVILIFIVLLLIRLLMKKGRRSFRS